MEAQHKHRQRSSSPDVTSALIDLARLSHHVGFAVSQDVSNTVTMALLQRLLTLCEAQRGALLLTIQNPIVLRHVYVSSLSGSTFSRTFALQGMSEAEALARIGIHPLEGPDLQSSPGEPCWMICRIPISSSSLSSETDHHGYRRDTSGELPNTMGPENQTLLPLYAHLVLGWTGKDGSDCLSAAEKSRLVFPLIADVAGAVIANILLAERVHELETSTNRQALREMELLKAELLATVSHELRSPLSSIKGYAATLLRHEHRIPREERREFLVAINEASDRLGIVIDRLLEMSQLDTGTIMLDPTPVNLVHLVYEAITALGEQVREKLVVSADLQPQEQQEDTSMAGPSPGPERTTIAVRLEDLHGMLTNEEPVIRADRHRLREVLDNLLENALTYSTEGGTIEVIVRPVIAAGNIGKSRTTGGNDARNRKEPAIMQTLPEQQQMIEVCVRDHGIGIPQEQLERIFDRFHRVDTRLTREVNGLGLGLAICKRIVELHNGVIWAESELGKGSSFHVWLPLKW
jgi:signal transduction histidine kinase